MTEHKASCKISLQQQDYKGFNEGSKEKNWIWGTSAIHIITGSITSISSYYELVKSKTPASHHCLFNLAEQHL